MKLLHELTPHRPDDKQFLEAWTGPWGEKNICVKRGIRILPWCGSKLNSWGCAGFSLPFPFARAPFWTLFSSHMACLLTL